MAEIRAIGSAREELLVKWQPATPEEREQVKERLWVEW
jgi:hypothetical protein